MNKPTVLIVHHTASGGNGKQFFAVNTYHKSKAFPISSLGHYVGYHYFIEKSGEIIQARAREDVGAHTLGGWNLKSLGVCLAGDFNYEKPTDAQIKTLKELRDQLELPMALHKEKQTNRTCPGKNFSLELLDDDEVDIVDEEKAKMIAYYIKKYPSLKRWILRILGLAS